MRPWSLGTLFASLIVLVFVALAPSPAAQAGQTTSQSPTLPAAGTTTPKHGTFTVELVKPLYSKKLKEGDEVEAKLTGNITLPSGSTVPRGAKVIGHVTQAKARSKNENESALGIVFDGIVQPGVGEIPIKGVVLAAARDPNPGLGGTDAGGNIYGHLDAATTASIVDTQTAPSVPILNEKSRGVLGINDVQLRPNGMFTSTGKAVKLDSGTRMLLSVTIQ
jgi:hypothetical protein